MSVGCFRTLKGQSSEILIPFLDLQYMDRPAHEYKPLRVLKFFKGPKDFTSEMAFLVRLRRNYLGKIIFFGNFLKIAETYFGVFFLEDRYVSETYFLTIKKFQKAAHKMIGFLHSFLAAFLNCFLTTAAAFGNL